MSSTRESNVHKGDTLEAALKGNPSTKITGIVVGFGSKYASGSPYSTTEFVLAGNLRVSHEDYDIKITEYAKRVFRVGEEISSKEDMQLLSIGSLVRLTTLPYVYVRTRNGYTNLYHSDLHYSVDEFWRYGRQAVILSVSDLDVENM